MADEYNEYVTFTVTDKDGNEVELAVVDEFEFDHEEYVAAAVVEDDTIVEDGTYIYKVAKDSEEFQVEKITDAEKYAKVAEAYLNMD